MFVKKILRFPNLYLAHNFKPHPRTEKDFHELHEKSQRLFHNYVLNQKEMRVQQQNIQYLLAITNNDADLLLSWMLFYLFSFKTNFFIILN